VSSKTGENVELFFRRIAVLTFEMGLASEITEAFTRPPKQIHLNASILRTSTSQDGDSRVAMRKCSSCKNI
jgi:hypothetical protein